MAVELIRYATLPVSPWRNGAGRKADIAIAPGSVLGFAWLDQDAAFSDYAGHDRTITLVSGPGFSLHFAGGAPDIVATEPYRPHAFDGGAPAMCRVAGPSIVLNAMTERRVATHRVSIVSGPATAKGDFVVMLAGALATPDGRAEILDALRLTEGAAIDLPAGTSAALIHFSPN
jgi:environmental stress-induced protein Ves